MKIKILMVLMLFNIHSIIYAQNKVYSEAEIIFAEGEKLSEMITVKFNCQIFSTNIKESKVELDNLEILNSDLNLLLKKLKKKYNSIKFRKKVPNAKWGEDYVEHKQTGKLVKIEDQSQLYSLWFNEYVPIEQIIDEFKRIDCVEYAHGPYSIVEYSSITPSDEYYSSQWNLSMISKAVKNHFLTEKQIEQ
ncbi:MAG: hypothetical protein JEY94_13185 [Melioribacteraceae bacterium]|nr:hypothetical protein [Melioribacteraceae bacterium]